MAQKRLMPNTGANQLHNQDQQGAWARTSALMSPFAPDPNDCVIDKLY